MQLYVGSLPGSEKAAIRPVRELKGFEKLSFSQVKAKKLHLYWTNAPLPIIIRNFPAGMWKTAHMKFPWEKALESWLLPSL